MSGLYISRLLPALHRQKGTPMKKQNKSAFDIKRGDIVFVELDPVIGSEQGGVRPAVILQNNTGNKVSPTTIIAPITSKNKPQLPTHVVVPSSGGIKKNSVLLLEQIRTVDCTRLISKIGMLDEAAMAEVDSAIRVSLSVVTEERKNLLTAQFEEIVACNLHKEHKDRTFTPRDIRTLCHVCRSSYLDAGYSLRRVGGPTSNKDTCDRCNHRSGFDYEVINNA